MIKRILLKISGDAMSGDKQFGIDSQYTKNLAKKIKEIYDKGLEIAITVGGGNIYRGGDLIKSGLNAPDSHNLSMLSTVFNGVVLKNFLEELGIKSRVLDPLGISFLEKYNKEKSKQYLESGEIVIFVGGTGNPYFTTDSGGVLRALENDCDFMIKATKVDGIYSSDPKKYSDAEFLKQISYDEFIKKDLKVLDTMSVVLARDGKMKIKVIGLDSTNSLAEDIISENKGSYIG